MSQHSRLMPSALALTIACNASVQLQEQAPVAPSTPEQAEGTAAHWVARRYLAGYGHELPIGAKFHSEGQEWTVNAEMHAAAKLYERTMGGYHPDAKIETRVAIARIHPQCWGTPDYRRFFPDARLAHTECPPGIPPEKFHAGRAKLLRVSDFKYGHRDVEIFENPQLAAYSVGAMDELSLTDNDVDLYVEMILVQPRSYSREGPVKIWRVQAATLRAIVNVASNAAEAALLPNPTAKTGAHCLDCEARAICATLRTNTFSLVEFSQTAETVELEPGAIGQELALIDDAIDQLTARRNGLAASAEAYLRAGKFIPFYTLQAGKSNLAYFDDVNADELAALGDLINVDIRRKLDRKDLIVTPTQAINLGIDPETMAHYAHRPPGKTQLTRINTTTAKKVFSK